MMVSLLAESSALMKVSLSGKLLVEPWALLLV